MSTPTRRPIRLRPLLGTIAEQIDRTRAEIELGWSALLDELRLAGWPARSPDGDRRPRTHAPDADDQEPDPSALDYADPTGELAVRLERLHDDRQALEDHRHLVESSLRALDQIARRHRPPSAPSIPACSLTACSEPVESRRLYDGALSFVGMVQVAGTWVAKPHSTPLCARHRKQRTRRAS